MYLYLSSYGIGDDPSQLTALFKSKKPKLALIINALDAKKNYIAMLQSTNKVKNALEDIGFEVERFDLREYFGQKAKLEESLQKFDGVFAVGGNVFILRMAYKLSGFDQILLDYAHSKSDFVYAGFSAGACVLSKLLTGLDLVDEKNKSAADYPEERLLTGLGFLPYTIVPHFRSDHSESQAMNAVIEQYFETKQLFIVLKDGEVIVKNTNELDLPKNL